MALAIGLEARRIGRHPQRDVLAAKVGSKRPGRLLLLGVGIHTGHHIDAPADVGHVRRVVLAGGEGVPLAGRVVVDVRRARQDVEARDIADDGGVVGLDVRADVTPPREHGARAGEELLEARGARVGVELVGGFRRQAIQHVLDGAHPARIVDHRLHRVRLEQEGAAVGVLHVSRGARAQEVEAEAAPALARVEVAIGVLAVDLLALEELGRGVDLLPGLRHAPFAFAAGLLPFLGKGRIREHVGAEVEVVAVAVARDAIGLAVPGTDRRLEVTDIVIHVDLLLDPVRHLGGKALAADVALEGSAHLDHVEVHRAGGDRLLQAGVVVGLREVDPVDGRTRVVSPGLGQAAEQHVVDVLVVEAHERQLDALEFAFLHAGLRRSEAHLANLLPVGIRRLALANTRNLQDRGADVILRESGGNVHRRAADGSHGGHTGSALQHAAAAHHHVVEFKLHVPGSSRRASVACCCGMCACRLAFLRRSAGSSLNAAPTMQHHWAMSTKRSSETPVPSATCRALQYVRCTTDAAKRCGCRFSHQKDERAKDQATWPRSRRASRSPARGTRR